MKKDEAIKLSKQRAELLLEYVGQILSDNRVVNAEIDIDSVKIEKERVCTFEIQVKENNYERHLNTGIPSLHIDCLTEEIFGCLIENILPTDQFMLSRYYSVKNFCGKPFYGVDVLNNNGSKLKINFMCRGNLFDEQIKEYENCLDSYEKGKVSNR